MERGPGSIKIPETGEANLLQGALEKWVSSFTDEDHSHISPVMAMALGDSRLPSELVSQVKELASRCGSLCEARIMTFGPHPLSLELGSLGLQN